MKKSARLAQKPLSSSVAVAVAVVPPSAPWIEIASVGTPMPISWSRATSAASRVSYIAVKVRSVIDGSPFLGDGVKGGAALQPLDLRPLGPEAHRLANDLGAAPSGDPDLFLEDQPGAHDQLL